MLERIFPILCLLLLACQSDAPRIISEDVIPVRSPTPTNTPTPLPTATPTLVPTNTPTPVPTATPTPTPTPIAPQDSLIGMLKEGVQAAIPEPTVLTCDTQWPESACIGMDDNNIFFTGVNRESDLAFIVDIARSKDIAHVQTCKFQWSLVHEGIDCNSNYLSDAEAVGSLVISMNEKWPKLLQQVLQGENEGVFD